MKIFFLYDDSVPPCKRGVEHGIVLVVVNFWLIQQQLGSGGAVGIA